jgi:hypothetical protein
VTGVIFTAVHPVRNRHGFIRSVLPHNVINEPGVAGFCTLNANAATAHIGGK